MLKLIIHNPSYTSSNSKTFITQALPTRNAGNVVDDKNISSTNKWDQQAIDFYTNNYYSPQTAAIK